MRARTKLLLSTFLVGLLLLPEMPAGPQARDMRIGGVTRIRASVSGQLDGERRKLERNLPIFQKEKIITETHIAQLKLEELQGSLVRKEAVAKEVGRLAQEYRDQLLSWPARIAAQMLADLQASGAEGLDQRLLNVTLERYVREHLSELGRVVRPARI